MYVGVGRDVYGDKTEPSFRFSVPFFGDSVCHRLGGIFNLCLATETRERILRRSEKASAVAPCSFGILDVSRIRLPNDRFKIYDGDKVGIFNRNISRHNSYPSNRLFSPNSQCGKFTGRNHRYAGFVLSLLRSRGG